MVLRQFRPANEDEGGTVPTGGYSLFEQLNSFLVGISTTNLFRSLYSPHSTQYDLTDFHLVTCFAWLTFPPFLTAQPYHPAQTPPICSVWPLDTTKLNLDLTDLLCRRSTTESAAVRQTIQVHVSRRQQHRGKVRRGGISVPPECFDTQNETDKAGEESNAIGQEKHFAVVVVPILQDGFSDERLGREIGVLEIREGTVREVAGEVLDCSSERAVAGWPMSLMFSS